MILGIIGGTLGLILGFAIRKFLTTVQFAGGPAGGAGFSHLFKPQTYIFAMLFANLTAAVAVSACSRRWQTHSYSIIREGTES